MKILHIAGGGDRGGAKTHILALCSRLKEEHQLKLLSMRKGEFADDARKLGIDTMEIQSGLLLRDFRIAKTPYGNSRRISSTAMAPRPIRWAFT